MAELKHMKLRECPFCGSEVELKRRNRYGNISHVIICKNEECFMHISHNRPSFYSEEEAIEAWNNRVTEAEIRNKAIDEFAEKIRDWQKEVYTNDRYVGELDFLFKHIYEIAEQLKEE